MGCPVTVSCGSPPDGDVGTPYTHTFPTTGGPNLFFSISAGALPDGLTLDPATGIVSGTPTTAGSFSFTVKVIDAQIMAAGDDGSFSDFQICIASDDGSTWSKVTTAISDSGWSIFYSESLGLWINGTDFASGTDQVQTSPDGISGNWTGQSSPANSSGQVHRIGAGPGLIIAIYRKSGTGHIMTSPDGVNWTEQFLPAGPYSIDPDAAIAYSPELGLYCIGEILGVNTGGNLGGMATSPDGVNWTIQPKAANMGRSGGLAWGNGLFVLVGGPQGSGEHLYTSPDGVTWTLQSDPGGSAQGWANVYFANGRFVAVSDDTFTDPGNQAAYSTDGINWTVVATPGSGKKWTAVSYGYGQWIACHGGFGTTQPLMSSTDDGLTWSLITLSFSYGFMNGIAFGPVDNCSDTANCTIDITGATMGNIWAGGSGQGAGNHW